MNLPHVKILKLTITPDVDRLIRGLIVRTGAKDEGELIRRAIATYDKLTEFIQLEGCKFTMERPDGSTVEIRIP